MGLLECGLRLSEARARAAEVPRGRAGACEPEELVWSRRRRLVSLLKSLEEAHLQEPPAVQTTTPFLRLSHLVSAFQDRS